MDSEAFVVRREVDTVKRSGANHNFYRSSVEPAKNNNHSLAARKYTSTFQRNLTRYMCNFLDGGHGHFR